MSDKPIALVKIDDLAANLRSTMARSSDVFPPSLRKQLSQIVSSYLRGRLSGAPFIHPGMRKMAKWGQCSERQARHNFSLMKRWAVVEIVAFPKGGRRSSRFVVHFAAIKALLVEMGTNPSTALCDKIRDAENPELNPEANPEANHAVPVPKNPEVCPAFTSAGIHTGKGSAPDEGERLVRKPLRIVGGRDA